MQCRAWRPARRRPRRRPGRSAPWSSSRPGWSWPGRSRGARRRMRPDGAMGLKAPGVGPLGRLDARATLLATVAYVVAVVATPPGAWGLLAIEAVALMVAVGVARASPF